jgi:HK97 family phage portal protein
VNAAGANVSLWSRLFRPSVVKAAEGEYRPGPYYLPVSDGWLSAEVGQYWNFWQKGYDVQSMPNSALVEACVSAYAQTIAMCPGDHWRKKENKGRERVTNSALARILREPNDYETISDHMLNTTRYLYTAGNSYALALRNSRFEIESLHLMDPDMSRPAVDTTGAIWYYLDGNPVLKKIFDFPALVPARDVLHIKLHSSDYDKLLGVSPLQAAAADIAASGAMTAQQLTFYSNMARPSSILTTDAILTKEQLDILRASWNEQTRGVNIGGTTILGGGLKPMTLQTTPKDAQLADILKMSQQNIALAFRIPLQMLGIGGISGSTEELMNNWLAGSLGFALNHIEEAFGRKFGLKGVPDEYLEFNTEALLRSAFKERIEAYTRAVQGGFVSPNEARDAFELEPVEYGDEPRVQQQLVPLSAAAKIEDPVSTTPIAPTPGPDSPPSAPPAAAPKKMLESSDELANLRRRFRASHARFSL